MKTILLLGGSLQQLIAIKTAKKMGYRTILCDWSEKNPGRDIADVFYAESIRDKERILEIAKKERIDGIISYACDLAVTTAAYVAERLNLPTNSYKSVKILSTKDLFRTFLKENGFNTPEAKGYQNIEEAINELGSFKLPIMIKPVDSTGSTGVSLALNTKGIKEKLEDAFSFSQEGKIIIEEYVEMVGYQISGDAILVDGKVETMFLGKQYFNKNSGNKFVPIVETYPYEIKSELEKKIKAEVQRLMDLLKMKSSMLNLEIRVDKNDNIYLMEVAPRNGGNYIPQIAKYAMNIDMVDLALKFAMGEKVILTEKKSIKGYWAYFIVGSDKKGKLKNVVISEDVKKNIVEQNMKVKPGELVNEFTGGNLALGVLIMEFASKKEMLERVENQKKWLQVELY